MKKRLQRFIAGMGMAFALFLGGSIAANAASHADLFDAAYYAEKNPDVAAVYGNDPKLLYAHYINCGINEGRNAGPLFDVRKYRENQIDLKALYGDNWAAYVNQYLTVGLPKEGRIGYGEFDAASYANRYPDLKNVFGYDLKRLYAHYVASGKKEGRNASYEATDAEKAAEKPKLGGRLIARKAQKLFQYTNLERKAWNLKPFTWDSSLAALAEERVMELPMRFEHIRPNGLRIYEYSVDEENIAMLYDDPAKTHEALMKSWTEANHIIDSDLTKIGIACYEVGGIYYWCQLFRE